MPVTPRAQESLVRLSLSAAAKHVGVGKPHLKRCLVSLDVEPAKRCVSPRAQECPVCLSRRSGAAKPPNVGKPHLQRCLLSLDNERAKRRCGRLSEWRARV